MGLSKLTARLFCWMASVDTHVGIRLPKGKPETWMTGDFEEVIPFEPGADELILWWMAKEA